MVLKKFRFKFFKHHPSCRALLLMAQTLCMTRECRNRTPNIHSLNRRHSNRFYCIEGYQNIILFVASNLANIYHVSRLGICVLEILISAPQPTICVGIANEPSRDNLIRIKTCLIWIDMALSIATYKCCIAKRPIRNSCFITRE
jgi:hypothetical protein